MPNKKLSPQFLFQLLLHKNVKLLLCKEQGTSVFNHFGLETALFRLHFHVIDGIKLKLEAYIIVDRDPTVLALLNLIFLTMLTC